jgi:hemolysin-activating ACP:hemolysin acyltransferase
LLPVRQVIKYFFVDNQMTEEIVETNKSLAKNFRFIDEDHHFMPEMIHPLGHIIAISDLAYFHRSVTLPDSHAADIPTPPPNTL